MGAADRTQRTGGELLMSTYLVDSADLTSVADAIRTKGGTSAQLEFPDGFVDAIDDIETGGGGQALPEGFYELQHIVCQNGAYLETSYVPVQYDEVRVAFTVYQWKAPVISAGNGAYQLIVLPYDAGVGNTIYARYFSSGNAVALAAGGIRLNDGYTLFVNKDGQFQLTGATSGADVAPYEGDVNSVLYVGKRSGSGVFFQGEIGKVLITNNGLAKLSLIPAMRKSDSMVGFYDLVQNTFLTSSGSTQFRPGPIVLSDAEALSILLGGAV